MFTLLPFTDGCIRLRPLTADDLSAFYTYRSDEEVAKYQGWSIMNEQQALAFLQQQADITQIIPDSWHQLAIESVDDNMLIGDVGIWFNQDLTLAEIGLSITPAKQQLGYGTATITALLKLLFTDHSLVEIFANTDHRNIACMTALQRAGMHYRETRISEYKGEWCTEQLFSIKRDELKNIFTE